jgi:excisionase family DNA binding protein
LKTHKRTEITIEIERVVVIRRQLPVRAWCQPCGAQVVMITVDEAAQLVRVSARTLYRWVENEKLHFTETAEGGLLICLNSIPPGTAAAE